MSIRRFVQFKARKHDAERWALTLARAALFEVDADLERLSEHKAAVIRAQRALAAGDSQIVAHSLEAQRAALLKARMEREVMAIKVAARVRESERELKRAEQMVRSADEG